MTVLGIDTSKWDGNWDANKAKQAGAAFVFVKSSQATFTDVQFAASWTKARQAGLLRGAYHYLDYTKPAITQAKYFADLLKDDPGELPPIVDYEQRRSDNNPSIALDFLRDFLEYMISRTELYTSAAIKVPMIYTGPSFWEEYGDKTQRDYWLKFPLWIANYTTSATPVIPAPWTMWTFWQFSARGPGEVFGSESLSIDMNRYNGTMNELLEFAGRQQPANGIVEPTDNLETRTAALEDAVSRITLSTDGQLMTRVEDIEQQITSLARTVTNSHAMLEQRLAAIESRLGNQDMMIASDTQEDSYQAPEDTNNEINDDSSASSASTTSGGQSGVIATCKVNVLNVRSGPGTTYTAVSHLSLGQQVSVIERQNGWARIEEPAGWAYEPYLSYGTNDPDPGVSPVSDISTSDPAAVYGVCNTSGLNVRSNAGNTYPIVGGLTYGQRVKILDRRDGWAQIESPAGWCNESYLSFNSN